MRGLVSLMEIVLWECGLELLPPVQVCSVNVVCTKLNMFSCIARGIFLSFQGTTYTTNNSNIVLTRIETTNDTSLTCHTDSTTCCRGIDKEPSSTMGTGEWNGTSNFRRKRVSDDGFYYIRFHQAIRLYRNNNTRTPLGTCCRIPDNSGVLRTFCANLIGESVVYIYRITRMFYEYYTCILQALVITRNCKIAKS